MIPYIPLRNYTETVRDTMATKEDEDADLVVEIGITAESPTVARRADVYSCWNSRAAPRTTGQRWSDVAVLVMVRPGAVDVGRSLS